jgi:hypothetical protein
MATAFMGGQTGYDEAGNPIGRPAPQTPKQPPLTIPKSLQGTLGTTPSPIKAPPVIAPQPRPAPAPLPTPETMATDEGFVQGLGKATPKDLPTLRAEQLSLGQAAAKEESQAKIDQARALATGEKSKTELMQDMAKQQKEAIEQHKKDIQEASPFAPSPETAKDIAGLFSLISVAAFGSGGKGRYAGMQTLASLTGAMKGYQAGRQDVYEKDIKAFEENLKVLKTHNEKVNALYEDAMKLMATNKELGLQKIQQVIAEDNTGIAARLARSGQYKALGEALNTVTTALQTAQDKIDKRKDEFARIDYEKKKQLELFKEEKKYEKPELLFNDAGKPFYIDPLTKQVVPFEGGMEGMRKTQAKVTGPIGPSAFLKDTIGKTTGDVKTDQKIVDLANGVSQMDHVITLFRDPEVKTGVISKLAGIKEKLASLGKGDPAHEISEEEFKRIVDGEIPATAKNAVAQKEALFAAYTAEREIAGGRLLVSVVKQAGGALDPTNYEKQGYLNLLSGRRNEMVKGLHGQLISDQDIAKMTGKLNDFRAATGATQPAADNPDRHYIGTEPIIPNKDNTGWIYEKTGKAVK